MILLIAGGPGRGEAAEWPTALFEGGRQAFFASLGPTLDRHPLRSQLNAAEVRKIRRAAELYPRLYGLLVNVYYQRRAPMFEALIRDGGSEARRRAAALYDELVSEASASFVESLFRPAANAEYLRGLLPAFRGRDRVDLVLLSLGYFAELSPPTAGTEADLTLSQEFDRQWGLEASQFPAAHEITLGGGVGVAVIDSGIDASHPIFRHASLGSHFALVGRDGLPWVASAPTFDSGGHGTMVASVVRRYAPEARITAYKKGDGDTTNNAPFPMLRAAMIAANIYRAVHDGNDVINISSGLAADDPYLREACRFAWNHNVLVVTGSAYALGRYLGLDATLPAQYDTTFAVTAIERRADGTLGPWTVAAADPSTLLAAPSGVFGAAPTYLEAEDRYVPSISAATPVAAAAAALAMSVYRRKGREAAGEYVRRVTRMMIESSSPERLGYRGFAPEIGHGLLDAAQLVVLAAEARKR